MKKFVTILTMLFVSLSTVACNVQGNNKEELCGTWYAVSTNVGGSETTVKELEAKGDNSISDFSITINDDGTAYIYSQGNSTQVDWEETKNGIKIGVQDCSYEDGVISLENNNVKINLKKTKDIESTSDIQSKNESEQQNVESTSVANGTNTNSTSSNIRPEFKEAMDSYENFFDEYVSFMEKYINSTDMASMMNDYTNYMTKYNDTMQKMNALGDEELSTDEALYYAEVSARITAKIAKVAQ